VTRIIELFCHMRNVTENRAAAVVGTAGTAGVVSVEIGRWAFVSLVD
jgi:hypothetical protein